MAECAVTGFTSTARTPGELPSLHGATRVFDHVESRSGQRAHLQIDEVASAYVFGLWK